MKKPVKPSKLYNEFSKLARDEQEQALEFVTALSSARKTAKEKPAGMGPEAPDMLEMLDELGIEITRLNFLYDLTSFIDPNSFRFTGTGASGFNLFIEERLEALRRISKGLYSGYKNLRAKR